MSWNGVGISRRALEAIKLFEKATGRTVEVYKYNHDDGKTLVPHEEIEKTGFPYWGTTSSRVFTVKMKGKPGADGRSGTYASTDQFNLSTVQNCCGAAVLSYISRYDSDIPLRLELILAEEILRGMGRSFAMYVNRASSTTFKELEALNWKPAFQWFNRKYFNMTIQNGGTRLVTYCKDLTQPESAVTLASELDEGKKASAPARNELGQFTRKEA